MGQLQTVYEDDDKTQNDDADQTACKNQVVDFYIQRTKHTETLKMNGLSVSPHYTINNGKTKNNLRTWT